MDFQYFQLLTGVHREIDGTVYRVQTQLTQKGVLVPIHQPIVKASRDLVAAFGPEKFRRLSTAEIRSYLNTESGKSEPDSEPTETEMAKAAKKGAVAIAEPPGKDVTDTFMNAEEAGLKVFRQKRGAYVVINSEGELLTAAGPITRSELLDMIKQYAE